MITIGDQGSQSSEELELRDQAVKSLKRKRRFVQSVIVYVTVNGVLWLIWLLTDRSKDGYIPWPAWISAVWASSSCSRAGRRTAPGPGACAVRSRSRTSSAR